jgi:hypothetical protein
MKLIIRLFSTVLSYFVSVRPKYILQHPILEHPQYVFC